MSERRPFHRPMRPDWWARKPYRAYTIRELTGVAVALYGMILLLGLICLWRGPAPYAAYLRALASPWSMLLHGLLLAAMLLHMVTWFQTLPKTMPKIIIGGRAMQQARLTGLALGLAVLGSALLLALAFGSA